MDFKHFACIVFSASLTLPLTSCCSPAETVQWAESKLKEDAALQGAILAFISPDGRVVYTVRSFEPKAREVGLQGSNGPPIVLLYDTSKDLYRALGGLRAVEGASMYSKEIVS